MKKYAVLQKKVQDLESKLTPILSIPPDLGTPMGHQPVSDGINQELLFINNLLSAEIALSLTQDEDGAHHRNLRDITHRVCLLQTTLRKWTEARSVSTFDESVSRPTTEFYLNDEDDDDYDTIQDPDHQEGEESPVGGFKVYDNPEFLFLEGDDDDDQDKLEEYEGVKQDDDEEEEEKEDITKPDDQVTERKEKADEDGDDDDTTQNCCYRFIFWVIMMGMGITSMMAGFSDGPDQQPSVLFLTPT